MRKQQEKGFYFCLSIITDPVYHYTAEQYGVSGKFKRTEQDKARGPYALDGQPGGAEGCSRLSL